MRRARGAAAVALAIMLSLLATPRAAFTASLFSTDGLGETIGLASGRGRALGGVVAPLDDSLRVSLENPALAAALRRVSISSLYLIERRTAENDSASETFSDGSFPFIAAAIPFPRGIVLSIGLLREQNLLVNPLVRARVESPSPYTLRFERDGDLFRVPFGFAVRLHPRALVGWNYDSWFGTVEETRVVDFDAADVRDTRDRAFDDVDGGAMSAGALVRPIDAVAVGFRYRGDETLTGEREVTTADGAKFTRPVAYRMPRSISGGATVALRGRMLVAFEVRRDEWADEEADAPPGGGFADATRIGGGIEFLPRAGEGAGSFLGRRPWRVGFHRAEWGVRDVDGDRIREWFATGGTTFTMRGGAGGTAVVDLVVEYGRRGSRDDNGLEESVLRIGAGFAGGEPWRKPERRGRRGAAKPPPENY